MAEDPAGRAPGQPELEAPPPPPQEAGGEEALPPASAEVQGGAEAGTPRAEERRESSDDGLGQLLSSMAQCTALAMRQRRGEQPARAIRQMERAVKMCQGREHTHPALAVEAARARLNLGGLLSCSGRHMEAVDIIKESQKCLAGILAWTADCEPGDPGVETIANEARTLHCAALVAEAIELEPFVATVASPSQASSQGRRGMHEELYREARAVAEDKLPPKHPMASLVARLSEECAVSARSTDQAEQTAAPGRPAGAPGRSAAPRGSGLHRSSGVGAGGGGRGSVGGVALVLPAVREQGGRGSATGSVGGGSAEASEAAGTPRAPSEREDGDFGTIEANGLSASGVLQNSGDPSRSSVARRSRTGTNSGAVRAHGRAGSSGGQAKGERHDVFTDFLRGAELEKEARLGPLHESMQDDQRKRLNRVHKTTRLELEHSEDDELKEKRYTRSGHKVFMRNLTRDNNCRSDPNLVSEARKLGESPELAQVKKLYRQLYVPPKTPEPVKVVPKPKPEVEFLKEQGDSFKRGLGFGKVPDVF